MWTYTSEAQTTVTDGNGTFVPCDSRNSDWQRIVLTGAPIAPYSQPPQSATFYVVSPRQLRLALLGAGLLEALEAWMAAQPEELRIAFEYSTEFREDSSQIIAAAAAFGLSGAQVRELFAVAAQL